MFLTHDIHAPLHVFNTLYSYTTCTYYIHSPLPVLYSNSTTCIYHTMFIHTTCTMFISYYNCWTCTELCTGQWMTLFNSVRARQGSQTCTAHTHRTGHTHTYTQTHTHSYTSASSHSHKAHKQSQANSLYTLTCTHSLTHTLTHVDPRTHSHT